jgi:calcineurin-like phosphoesterase family protein
VIYSHKPLKNFPDGVIYNVHGHWHDNDHREDESVSFYDRRRHIKLAIEDTNYTPITVSDILYKGKLLASAKDDNKDNLGKFKT